jgi:hypothetical protein
MVVLGICFRCFDALLLLSAATDGKGLFTRGSSKEERFRLSLDSQSDHLATINAFRKARRLRDQKGDYQEFYEFVTSSGIDLDEFERIDSYTRQIEETLVSIGLLPYTEPTTSLDSQRGPPSLN